MIVANVKFGRSGNQSKGDLEDLVETYLARLLHQGQLGSEYIFAWVDGVLNAYVQLVAVDAHALRHHSDYGKETLTELRKAFGKPPEWKILDEASLKSAATWRSASSLYLFTHAFDDGPSFCRGDNGRPVPSYMFPISYEVRENIYFWQHNYRNHDHVWLGCGALEIPAYRQLADPNSDLSQDGRDLCKHIEKVTGVPTYYFLMRYWARRTVEDKRKCPGCGQPWRTKYATEKRTDFWLFAFRCYKCRLVSHLGDSFDDERHAAIGEFKIAKRKANR